MQLHTRPAAPPAAVSTRVVGALTALLLAAGPAHAQQWVFAPAADAQRLLSSRDDFVARLSPFDRAARMKTDRDVAEPEFLEFAGAAALDWDEREVHAIEAAANAIRPRIAELGLPLPREVILVKTTGSEEGDAAYTRGNAVILPRRKIDCERRRAAQAARPRALSRRVAHESRARQGVVCGDRLLLLRRGAVPRGPRASQANEPRRAPQRLLHSTHARRQGGRGDADSVRAERALRSRRRR